MHTHKDPNGEAIVRLGLDLLDASEKLHPVVNDLMAYKRLSKADAACRAIIRPPAGRLIKQYSRRNRAMSGIGTTATFSPERFYVRTPPDNRPPGLSVGLPSHSRPGLEGR